MKTRDLYFSKSLAGKLFRDSNGLLILFHCNDWQTSLIPVLSKSSNGIRDVRKTSVLLFSIHNIGNQARFSLKQYTMRVFLMSCGIILNMSV
ncbi:MAG: glycogen/starch synthase [Ignavibacteria bacterium]|nr:glycogen/starch synthase [Ignavibacteria bacterium]